MRPAVSLLVTSLACAVTWQVCSATPPNIVLIIADDLGWNDIGVHNPHIYSPNIDRLAREGILLDKSYGQPLCSPSRSSMFTGVYPFRLGLQHSIIKPQQPVCVPFNRTFLPEELKAKGYHTHVVGKWHLGFCKWECTPTYRGFDSFYGFYNGDMDYYNKSSNGGYDFRFNTEVATDAVGVYSLDLYVNRTKAIIAEHDTSDPLFMYLSYQNPHSPLEVTQKYYDMYANNSDHKRRTLSSMVTALDDAVGEVVQSLKDKGLYDNTLIVFSSDNGGWPMYGGNNYPLRGGKFTIFEGGTRVFGFVHGPMFNQTGGTYDGLMHVSDWFPTLAEAAEIHGSYADLDGVSQWKNLLNLSRPHPRHELVYNLDFGPDFPEQGRAAIRIGDYKYIDGYPGMFPLWYPPAGEPIDGEVGDKFAEETISMLFGDITNAVAGVELPTHKYLFNLKDDPNEHNNLYHEMPEIANELSARMDFHKTRMVDPNFPAWDPKAEPSNWGGVWTPGWC